MNKLHGKLAALKAAVTGRGSALVAFSGGVDSSFLLKVCMDALGADGRKVLAVTARSSTYPQRELDEAVELAKSLGAEHMIIDSEELDIEGYADNPPNRCYYCKGELFGKLIEIATERGIAAVYDGANADDAADWRPGSQAASELGVISPLKEAGITKDEIRELSKEMGLPTWNKPAFACLASRFPYGSKITRDKLRMVELAEQALRNMGFRQLRVRHHGEVCRIELEPEAIQRAVAPETAARIHAAMREIGFTYTTVDIVGYRTGAMNEALNLKGRA